MILRPLPLLAGMALGLLVLIAAFWLVLARPWVPPAPVVPDTASLAPLEIVRATPDAAVLVAIAERPLFIAERRPVPASADAAAEQVAAKADAFDNVRLLGILGGEVYGVAIVNTNGVNRRIRKGEQLDGWTLQDVAGRVVRFSRGDGEIRELVMTHGNSQRKAPDEPPAPGASSAATPPGRPGLPPPAAHAGGQPTVEELVAARRARREALLRSNAN